MLGIVDRHIPKDAVAIAGGRRGDRGQVGRDEGVAPEIRLVAKVVSGEDTNSEIGRLDLDVGDDMRGEADDARWPVEAVAAGAGLRVVAVELFVLAQEAVEEGHVRRIDVVLDGLHVIAVGEVFLDQRVVVGRDQRLVMRQDRRRPEAQIGEDQAAELLAGIGRVANLLAEVAAGWLARLFKAVPRRVIEPAVVEAPDAAFLDPAVAEV